MNTKSELTITDTHMHLRGAEAPAPIVDRRLDGRLLVAASSKKNRWIVIDQAFVPVPLIKRIRSPSKVVEERIVVPVDMLDTVLAQVEAWLVGGGQEQDAERAAAAAKAAATRKAKAEAKAAAEREAARIEAAAAREVKRIEEAERAAEEAKARRAAADAARPALIEACRAIAAGHVTFSTYPGFDGEFVVRTPYDPRIVEVLRAIAGARWDAARRVWTVPARSHAALGARVAEINAWAEQTAAAEAEAERVAREARRALNGRRYLVLADSAPAAGDVVQFGSRLMAVESLGKVFRAPEDDGLHDPWMEGEPVRYVYVREATEEELAAHAAKAAERKRARSVAAAAETVLAQIVAEGERIDEADLPVEREVILVGSFLGDALGEDRTISLAGGMLYLHQVADMEGNCWTLHRVEATPERVAALRAEAARIGFKPVHRAPAMRRQPVQQQQACAARPAVGLGFEAALADCKRAAGAGVIGIDDPEIRFEKASAWADDMHRGGLITAALRDRLHAEIQATAEQGAL